MNRYLVFHLLITFAALAALPAAGEANLVANGSFEELANGAPVSWACEGDAGVQQTLSSDAGVTGGRAAKLACTAFHRQTRESYATLTQTGFGGLEKGKWYRFSCWARQEGMASGLVTVELIADMKAMIPYTTSLLFMQFPLRREWQRFDRYFQATSPGTDSGKLMFYFDFPGTLYVDDVAIVESPAPESRLTDTIPAIGARNLLPNGSFECGTDQWLSLGKPVTFAAGLVSLYGTVEAGGAQDGSKCLRIDLGPGKTVLSTFNWQSTWALQTAPLAASVGWMQVAKGKPYTLSAYMKADADGIPAKLEVHYGGAMAYGAVRSQDATLTTEWKRYTFTGTADADWAFVAVGPDMTARPDANATVWVDAIQFEEGGAASPFVPREPFEIGFDTGRPGNVYDYDAQTPPAVTLYARNETAVDASVPVRLRVRDYFDATVSDTTKTVALAAKSGTSLAWPLGVTAPGFYRVDAEWVSGGAAHARSLRVAVVNPYKEKDSVFGMNHAPTTDEQCRLVAKAGMLWAREWALNWEDIEPKPGEFTFETADRHINRVLGTGMQMVQQLPPFPSTSWNTSAPAGAKEFAPDVYWGLGFYPPKDESVFERYCETTVQHFRDRFHTYEYLNEPLYTIHSLPNIHQMDATAPHMLGAEFTVNDYIRWLKVFNAAVKKADPSATTVGGLGGRPDLLTAEFFAAGGLEHLDAFNLHIYPGLRIPECYIPQMEELLRNMDASAAGRKPIWITEYAYYGADQLPWEPFVIGPVPWAHNRLLRDERECGDFSVRFALIMLAHGAEKVFYHCDGVSVGVNGDDLGSWLSVQGGWPRKVYAAQAAMADLLGPAPKFAAKLAKPESVGGKKTDAVYGYAYQCGPRAVLAAWAPTPVVGHAAWKLRVPSGVAGLSVVGAPLTGEAVSLGESPVYLVSGTMAADALAKACALEAVE